MSREVESIMAYGLSNTAIGNMSTIVTDVTVNALNTDAATGVKETSWQNTKWSTYWGYFNAIPELAFRQTEIVKKYLKKEF